MRQLFRRLCHVRAFYLSTSLRGLFRTLGNYVSFEPEIRFPVLPSAQSEVSRVRKDLVEMASTDEPAARCRSRDSGETGLAQDPIGRFSMRFKALVSRWLFGCTTGSVAGRECQPFVRSLATRSVWSCH